MKKPRHFVSDRAVIRHLELVQGVDIEALRRRIGRKVDLAADYPGCKGVVCGGLSYKVENGVVTTVIPVNGVAKRIRRKHRGRRC